MSKEDLEEEQAGILKWLFDAVFGRREAAEEEIGGAIHRLGDVKQALRREDD